jgi:hypothetical protein
MNFDSNTFESKSGFSYSHRPVLPPVTNEMISVKNDLTKNGSQPFSIDMIVSNKEVSLIFFYFYFQFFFWKVKVEEEVEEVDKENEIAIRNRIYNLFDHVFILFYSFNLSY